MSHKHTFWLKFFPRYMRSKIENRPNLLNAMANTGWLFGDKVLRMVVGLLVGVWVARYLGPEKFGLMNYALAIVGLFGALSGLGLNQIVVRDLVRHPETTDVTLGTAFSMQLVGGLLAFTLAFIAINILRPDDTLAITMVAVLGFAMMFKAAEVVKYWFESQVQLRHAVIIENITMLVTACVRVAMIMLHAPLMAFVWVMLAEAAIVATLLLIIYVRRIGTLKKWTVSISRAQTLLIESWPVILSAIASMINMRVDQLMLGRMSGDVIVGNYAAAVRISEIWLTIPVIIGSSIYPAIIASKKISDTLYKRRILQVTGYMAAIAIPAAILITFLSPLIVGILYGEQFKYAATYLSLLIWTGVPHLIFFAVSQMFFIEGMVRHTFYISIIIIVSNIFLNLILIPKYGGTGAAIATMVTAYVSAIISMLLINARTKLFFGSTRSL